METLLKESASCKSFHFMKDTHTKTKIPNALGQKHQVVHDHYIFESLNTTGSSITVQLSKVCPRGNGGSPVLFASRSLTSTMSILRLPNVSTTSTITSSSLPWITSRLMKPIERNKQLSSGMSIFVLSFSFLRKLAIHFSLFSSTNFCFPCLSSLYPRPNLSLFWITAIGLSMPCNRFPNPFSARALLPDTYFMPRWVTLDNFGIGILAHSFTYMALTSSRNLKEHSIVFSSAFT